MRVCKHGCDVKMFFFSRANDASTTFLVQNSTILLQLPIPAQAETWKIFTNKLYQFLFAQADILSEKIRILESVFFAKQELITRASLRVQDFATGKNFSFNQCHNKGCCVFLGKVIL